ncbi:MAG: copper homeostasis protein CutC [Bacteroidetes bacterium]|nr:copper homeostasis protein CutC [Bacteroidota bacterium]
MQDYILEIAAFTLEGALLASEAGAQRIELCDNAEEGGTTPSYGMLKLAKEKIRTPIFPIIRPRGGDFVYSDEEYEAMKYDISLCKQLSFEGVVIGILLASGQIDKTRTTELVKLAKPMQVTFHRAFDRCNDPMQALEDIIDCGCNRILTSGQFPSVMNGLTCIKQLIHQAAGRIIIMPGSGLKSTHVAEIANVTGATEFHTAARKKVFHEGVSSPLSMNENLTYVSVDTEEIQDIRKILDAL